MTAVIPADLPVPRALPKLSSLVWLLGVSQIIGVGTIFYSYALLVPGVAAELHAEPPFLFGMLSIGLFVGGLASPRIGRFVDRVGGPIVLCIGSAVTAAMFAVLGLAPSTPVFAGGVILLQVVAIAAMFSAANPTLAHFGGTGAQRAIALLVALVGFSSTIFLPLIGVLETYLGWRGTYFVMAGMHLFISLPIHLWLYRHLPFTPMPHIRSEAGHPTSTLDTGTLAAGSLRRLAFWAVGISFALTGAIAQAIAFQIVPVLQGVGLGTAAFLVGMILGPAQAVIRFGQAVIFRRTHPLIMGLISAACLPVSILVLCLPLPPLAAGLIFVTIYGLGQGLNAIVSGTLPLELFGRAGYAEMLGRMALIRVLLSAPAPFMLSAVWAGAGLTVALSVFIAMGIVAVIPLIVLRSRMMRAGVTLARA